MIATLDKADEPFLESNWSDMAEVWVAMANLIPKMHCERCQIILQCVFSDIGVRMGLGAARQYKGVRINEAPKGFLQVIKDGPGQHMKASALVPERPVLMIPTCVCARRIMRTTTGSRSRPRLRKSSASVT